MKQRIQDNDLGVTTDRLEGFGFTLIELLVVVTIIVALLALLVPALDKAIEASERAVCSSNLRSIFVASTTYALQNKKQIIKCRPLGTPYELAGVQIAFNPPEVESLSAVGLAASSRGDVGGSEGARAQGFHLQHEPSKLWDCPSRGFRSRWELNELEANVQMVIGYQYMGGIGRWTNFQTPYPGIPSRSPLNLTGSRPHWVLSADTTAKIDGAWGAGRSAFAGMPSHKQGDSLRPAGGNQVHMDGSVAWFDYTQMLYIHGWTNDPNRIFFWHQKDLGFVVTDGRLLPGNN